MSYRCNFCENKFNRINNLKKHLKNHLKQNLDFIHILNISKKTLYKPKNINFDLLLNNLWADCDIIYNILKN